MISTYKLGFYQLPTPRKEKSGDIDKNPLTGLVVECNLPNSVRRFCLPKLGYGLG